MKDGAPLDRCVLGEAVAGGRVSTGRRREGLEGEEDAHAAEDRSETAAERSARREEREGRRLALTWRERRAEDAERRGLRAQERVQLKLEGRRAQRRTMAAPSAAPCMARKKSIETSFCANPQAIDQMTNQTMPSVKTLRARVRAHVSEERAPGSARKGTYFLWPYCGAQRGASVAALGGRRDMRRDAQCLRAGRRGGAGRRMRHCSC